MSQSLRRAVAFAAVASIALVAPLSGPVTAGAFGAVAAGAFATTGGRLFELFAGPGDRVQGRLAGLVAFALGATGLALLVPAFEMPRSVVVASVLLVGYGNLAAQAVRSVRHSEILTTAGYAVGGAVGAAAGFVATAAMTGTLPSLAAAQVAFLAASGALLAALLRAVFGAQEDPVSLLSVGLLLWLLLWLLSDPAVQVSARDVAVALAVTVAFGYASWALETASIAGMLTGVFLGLLALVLGGWGWFVILIAFFSVGGLSSKYRYEEKRARGVAEERGGARGSGNVLGNAAPAIATVVLFSAGSRLSVEATIFTYAFAGSVATALGDTLSSEIGSLYDGPRLITTLERVEPGTDGAVTWQGELAGLAGTAVVAGLAMALFGFGPAGAAAVVVAGLLGMTADSLLGALLEGGTLNNQSVNFLATSTGAVAGALFAVAAGLPF